MDDGLSPIDRIKRKARSSDTRTEKLIGYEDFEDEGCLGPCMSG